MRPWMVRCAVLAAVAWGTSTGTAFAQELPAEMPCLTPMPVTYERACRAGMPRCQRCWAKPSNGRWDYGYYVGGGTPHHCGDLRDCTEGTFGWDYSLPWSRTRLRWLHGRLRQAGEGNYESARKNSGFDDTFCP